jgi:hypothetical protein
MVRGANPPYHSQRDMMSERAVKETFEALFALTDLRQIFRETKPLYKLDEAQKARVREILERVRTSLRVVQEELLK